MKPGKTLLEYVLEERRKELAFEGHRRFDIFRNGLTMNRSYPVLTTVAPQPRFA